MPETKFRMNLNVNWQLYTMKRPSVIPVHVLLLCVLGAHSKEACSRKGELESTDANDDALSIPRCPVSVNLLKVGMMIPRQNNYQLGSQALPEWTNATLVQQGRRFAFNNFGLLSFASYIRAIILAGSQDLASWLPPFDKSVLADTVAKASLTSAFETLGTVSAEGVQAEDLKRMLEYITIDERTKDPKKYAKVALDEAMWEAMEYDLKMSPFSKDFQNFPHDFQRMRKWQLPVNQFSLALGHYTLFGLPFSMKNITVLLNGSGEEKEGWLHLWAVLGSTMGLEDGFNIALLQNLDEVAAYYKEIVNAYVVPSFHHLTRQQKVLIEAVLKASSAMMPLDGLSLTPRLNMVIFLEEFLEIEAHKSRSLLDEEQNYSLKLWQDLKLYMHDISFLNKNPYLLSSFNEEVRVKVVTVE